MHAEQFVRRHTDFEGTVECFHIRWHLRPERPPEPGRPHIEERFEAEPAEVIERIRRRIHPFYNGSFDVARCICELPDLSLDQGSVWSGP